MNTSPNMYGVVAHGLDDKSRTDDVNIVQDVVFPSLLLPDFILRGLERAGFKKPSPIQLAAIPLARCGLDLIVQAKSGTGKTLVFSITALESIKVKVKRLQVIILAPTREIAIQIADVIKSIGRCLTGLKVGTFIGGTPMELDKVVSSSCHVAIGAPGRVRHLIEQGLMDTSAVRLFILDEADKLMEDIFLNDINYIFNKCCTSKQTVACSATYTPQLLEFVQHYMRSGRHVVPEGSTLPVLLGLRQFVHFVPDHHNTYARLKFKQGSLFNLLKTIRFDQALIFTNYITRAESLSVLLNNEGWSVACLTGKQSQEIRNESVERLKDHKASILVATDLASRGLDASSVNLVINLDIPLSGSTYLHRMGRAGRYGSQGICITIISEGIEHKRFCKMLGGIGGTAMSVNIAPDDSSLDLWTVNMDNLPKLYGTISVNEDDHSPPHLNFDSSEVAEYNSTPIGSGTESQRASSETDSIYDLYGQLLKRNTIKKTNKISCRNRKLSNSLREQIEVTESSDEDQQECFPQEQIDSKRTLSFSCNDSNIDISSSSSKNSYKSSDDEENSIIEDDISLSSNVDTTDEELSINEEMEKLKLTRRKPFNSKNSRTTNFLAYPTNQRYNVSNFQNYNYPSNQQLDWHIRIEMQIQNFVRYTHNFQAYNFNN